ncbi:transketolase family protein, partial [Candidatus Woesearchaeota archaeon]|nr:transketolase family protein [Candidatus Woesearchaeota archaeon]
VALMRSLPNMIVVVPADYEQTKKATMALAAYQGPTYMRFAREKTEQMTTIKTPFVIGKAQLWKEGKDIAIIAAGPLAYESLVAADVLEQRGIYATVINCHTIKPLDGETILAAARKCQRIITVEEAQINGALGGAVAEFLSEHHPTKMARVGVRDHFGESGEPNELLKKFGLSAEQIVKEALKLIRG